MKFQSASRKEIRRVALGVGVCDGIVIAALFLLSLAGIGTFRPLPVFLGAACGSAVAIGNFALLCLTVQTAAETEDRRAMRRKFQLSYNLRLLVQAAWVVACYLIPQIHFIAGAAPILFPNLVVYYLQFRGRLISPGELGASPRESSDP